MPCERVMNAALLSLTVWTALAVADGGPCVDDVPSRAARADLVIDGRVRGRYTGSARHRDTSSHHEASQSYFNVTLRPRRVIKGWLQRTHDGAGYLPVVVGPFALNEDRVNCVPAVTVGARYLVFLAGNGTAVSGGRPTAQQTMLFFQLSGFPAVYSSETASLARQYSCTGCSK